MVFVEALSHTHTYPSPLVVISRFKEVMIGNDKQLIHSKRTAGQGRAESAKERAMIVESIEEYLEDKMTL